MAIELILYFVVNVLDSMSSMATKEERIFIVKLVELVNI
jgi:hypothetical protein